MQYNYRKTKTQQRNEQFLNKNSQDEKGNDINKRTGKEFHTRTMQEKELIKTPNNRFGTKNTRSKEKEEKNLVMGRGLTHDTRSS